MKLNLLFMVMDVLTLLAYPIVFVYAKLHQFAKLKEGIRSANVFWDFAHRAEDMI